ncbi:methyltransferase domain-containing protein [Pseudodesulfovibrio cashew]|uniref:Methyltransferase domain-containing protein n=1 Tax=Pseudodesulfovibrio cashew TaxID=2678688 RepID=A0A6I6JHK6_9BACT|nr:class I SAM-dependent methyltransferase [Pseudodesulfovibrio cashew]QGY40510.1 methyltransferase domain-containing protein [Pseudodesulfovibrio cashew]
MAIEEKNKDFYRYTENHRFASMYPLLAREIVEEYGVTSGSCLDIGTGSAAMAIELAKLTDLQIAALDPEPEAIELAKGNLAPHGINTGRIRFIEAAVEDMPLPDASVDLVVSRGSIPFWKDAAAAFREIWRVLAKGGVALIGCGFSHYQTVEEVEKMRPNWSPEVLEERTRWKKGTALTDALHKAGITYSAILDDSYGTWVEIRKPEDV